MKGKKTWGLLTVLILGLVSFVSNAHGESVIIMPFGMTDGYDRAYEPEGDVGDTSAYVYTYAPVADGFFVNFQFPPEANGKRIYRLTVSFFDFDAGDEVTVYLRKTNIYINQSVEVGRVNSGVAYASNQWSYMKKGGNTMSYRTIDNTRYGWHIFIDLGDDSNTRVGPIKIEYY